jgi:hypothetical protein
MAMSNQATKKAVRADAPPVATDALQAERDLLHVGRLAREVLQAAKMPQHFWRETLAHELVVTALGLYQKERKRVLNQRASLRRLHAKLMEVQGALACVRAERAALRARYLEQREELDALRKLHVIEGA